jgi:hypothetical protein
MKSANPEPVMKWAVVLAALVLLAGFFIFPWVKDWGRADTIGIFTNPKVYGDAAYEIAAYAPILRLIPVGAILAGGLALVPFQTSRAQGIKWLSILLIGVVILYPHAWVTDTLQIRSFTNPALKNEWVGTLYDPWENNMTLVDSLVNRYNDVLGGESYPDHGYYISLAADGVIIITSLVSLLQRFAIKAEQSNL